MSQRITKTAFVIALAFAGTAFAENLPVVASFSILGDVAKQIGGERVSVTSLVGPDQDAHAYQINSGDVKKIAAAKLVLLNGLGLEQADVIRAVQQSRVPYAEAKRNTNTIMTTTATTMNTATNTIITTTAHTTRTCGMTPC